MELLKEMILDEITSVNGEIEEHEILDIIDYTESEENRLLNEIDYNESISDLKRKYQ